MARDRIGDHFGKRQQDRKLADLADKARGKDDIADEKQLLKDAPKAEPIHAKTKPKRNAPCPCGSGKKYKNCCGAQ